VLGAKFAPRKAANSCRGTVRSSWATRRLRRSVVAARAGMCSLRALAFRNVAAVTATKCFGFGFGSAARGGEKRGGAESFATRFATDLANRCAGPGGAAKRPVLGNCCRTARSHQVVRNGRPGTGTRQGNVDSGLGPTTRTHPGICRCVGAGGARTRQRDVEHPVFRWCTGGGARTRQRDDEGAGPTLGAGAGQRDVEDDVARTAPNHPVFRWWWAPGGGDAKDFGGAAAPGTDARKLHQRRGATPCTPACRPTRGRGRGSGKSSLEPCLGLFSFFPCGNFLSAAPRRCGVVRRCCRPRFRHCLRHCLRHRRRETHPTHERKTPDRPRRR
jgi:hypothetical protein